MFFYSADRDEPPHVHVARDSHIAKVWLDPVRLASSSGFGNTEINRIIRLVEQHEDELRESWSRHFDG